MKAPALLDYMIRIDQGKCDGCMECTKACSTHIGNMGQSVIFVEKIDDRPKAITCMQCVDAPCLRACPTEAISNWGEFTVLSPDESKCIACNNCIIACPFGVMVLFEPGKLALKCDKCMYRVTNGEMPLCVLACPTKAISFENPLEAAASIRKKATSRFILSRP